MPYTRPNRKALPGPHPEDGDTSYGTPRSESYLRISDLANTSTLSQAPPEPPPLLVSQSTGFQCTQHDTKGKRPMALSPLVEVSRENSPAASIPKSEPTGNAIPEEQEKSPSQRSSDSHVLQQIPAEFPLDQVNSHEIPSPSLHLPPQRLGLDSSMDKGEDVMLEASKRLEEYDIQQNLPAESIGKQHGTRIPPDNHVDSFPARGETPSEESSNNSIDGSSVALPSPLSDLPNDDSQETPLRSTKIVIGSPAKPQVLTKCASTSQERKEERKHGGDSNIAGRGLMSQSVASSIVAPSPGAEVQARQASTVAVPIIASLSSETGIPVTENTEHMASNRDLNSSRRVTPVMPHQSSLQDIHSRPRQITTPVNTTRRPVSATSQQSAAAHIAVRQGDALRKICYGPVQFADIAKAYNESAAGQTVLDYPLLKRLDDAIFFRADGQRDSIPDGTIRSSIVTSETRLLFNVQQFMLTAALLPTHQRVFGTDVGPDPLVKFVDDAEALIHYMIDDIRNQQDLFAPSISNLKAFVQDRCLFAQASQVPSFYFRHEISDITLKYVQGLCETICGLWPNGKFFIGAEGAIPRDSFTPAHFHGPKSLQRELLTSQFDKYFHDSGLLGYVVATDYRQLFRGAFPFLMDVGRVVDRPSRPERERDMSVDAWYVEKGVFKFERTTFVREHLLVDSARRVRIYVDDFEGTRYLVYFNHRVGRLLGLSHLGFEILKTYNLLFLSNWRSRQIAQRLGLNVSSIEQFDSIFPHRQIFDAPHVDDFLLFRDRLCLFQHRLATFRPEKLADVFKGGYAEPVWQGVVWFMITIVTLVIASILATVLVNVLVH